MENIGIKNPSADLAQLGIKTATTYWNLAPALLVEKTLAKAQGVLNDTGALVIKTGKFTGRSPNDRYVVCDDVTRGTVDWGKINFKFEPDHFEQLYTKVVDYLSTKEEVYVRDAYACADPENRLNVRVVTEFPWQSIFVNNMFLRPSKKEVQETQPDWTVISAPGFLADPLIDGTTNANFAIINFTKQIILIGGTGYTGEIKKGIFSVLNYTLPKNKNILSMHCSANVGEKGDTALFFGLSGTGKTTLSADPNRKLIGDDEHGWSSDRVFNFEGGCYAKCIDLSPSREPDIYGAIKFGALLENVVLDEHTRTVDYTDCSITPNTRVSYPIYHIQNLQPKSTGDTPKNIFFLTCDSFGVLPPISKLTIPQAKFHFVSGYTAKVAGTEVGVVEPQAIFSACFGDPFLPLHPMEYADMLGEKLATDPSINVWLVNTGWTGGPFGVGSRMRLRYTRAMVTAALNGELDQVDYTTNATFNLAMPNSCPNVPSEVLHPRNTWKDKRAYDEKAQLLAKKFVENFKLFADKASEDTKGALPKVMVEA